uniref:Uncharacterized protein LOC100366953 n=1 Tax=Saccoglossus kowalevskii TaxID=10224 RepID=A0ABM0M0H6_SACKO
DPHSGIREIDFGLGKSNRDVYLLGWQRHDNITHISLDYCIEDGIPAWFKIRATNNVYLRGVGHSDFPIIVDRSPPEPGVVFDGDNHGVDIDFQSMPHICANWQNFHDLQSGISKYTWGVGTNPGNDDVVSFHDIPHTVLQLCSMNISLTHNTTYYSTVFAYNAGHKRLNVSVISNGVLYDATPPMTGELRDGLDPHTDMMYSSESSSVSANWDGYDDPESGIGKYDVSVYRRHADIDSTNATSTIELIHGVTSLTPDTNYINWHHFHLHHGDFVYVQLDAVNKADNPTTTQSDGFTIDMTNPIMHFLGDGVNTGVDLQYSESVDSLAAEWEITEDESIIIYTSFSYGSYSGAHDIYNITDVTDGYSVPNGMVVPEGNGKPNILTLRSLNKVGLWTESISGSVTVDTSPPIAGTVECPRYSVAIDELFCSWSHFYDEESFISHYEFGIGTSEGDDSRFPYTKLPTHVTSYRARDLQNGGLQHNGVYYATVIAYNGVGLKSQSFSLPIVIDGTPPIPGSVIELSGVDEIDVTTDNTEQITTCSLGEDCAYMDVVCQKSLTQISLSWQPFQDPDTPIIRYQVAAGTSPGGTQLQEYQDVPLDSYYTVITGLDLTDVKQGYVSVKATNAAGLTSIAMSNGVFISRITQGLPSIGESYVWDGDTDKDLDYQENIEMLSGHWDFSGDPCPIRKYEWSIQGFDGTEIQPMVELPEGQTYGENDQVSLKDGESYYLVVRATNLLGYTQSIRSNGISIQKDPLLPGQVKDGDVIGFDINYQPSVTLLSSNWDGFGLDGLMTGEIRGQQHQMIEHYEVAAGTDRRYPTTRTNIHPFIHVGLNKTHTFTDLHLVPKSVTYYITVRAYSVSTAMKEVTSNGIQVGYGGKAVSLGEVRVSRYIPSKTTMTIAWGGFEFTMPIMFYQWGIGTVDNNIDELTCTQLQNFNEEGELLSNPEYSHLFDMHSLTNTGKDTMVSPDDLEFEEGQTYTVVVIATDESAQCSLVTDIITIDTTPPVEGRLQIGAFQNEDVMYTKQPEQLDVTWSGYYDDISGIQHYELALYEGQSCQDSGDLIKVKDYIKVLPNDTDYTFLDLQLQPSRPYFVHLRATNNADLSVITISPPILLDVVDPISGVVKDGDNYKVDRMYQSSTNHMEGVFLHLPNPDIPACPTRDFSLDNPPSGTDWLTVIDRGIWSLNAEQRIVFTNNQVSYADNGLSITMTRDVNNEEMKSAAVSYANSDVHGGGKYQVDILAAGGETHAVSSFIFWDGPSGVVGDFNAPLGEKSWQDSVIENKDCTCCENDNMTENSTQETVTSSQNICECNCTAYFKQIIDRTTPVVMSTDASTVTSNPWQVIEDVLPGKTYTRDESIKNNAQTAIGLQLHSGVSVNGEIKHFAVVWSRYVNDTYEPKHEIIELSFDPSQAWHTYCLVLTMDDVGDKTDWTVEFFIDDVAAAIMSGVPHLSDNAKLIMTVWNRLDFVPEITDFFNPPTSTASFRNLRLPPFVETLCRYGDPFRNGENAIEGFMAGIGSQRLQDDVVPFRIVTSPCIPCVKPCDLYNCDSSCSDSTTSVHHIVLGDLNLNPDVMIEEDGQNKTVPVPYYLTVKGVTGSGRSAVASSNGVIIDVTPPVIADLYHVDMSWSDSEPTEYQSSNTTIAARWEVYDIGSQVKDIQFAIGTTPHGIDLQDFTSVGLQSFALNDDLDLVNRDRYYVTLKVTNNAGLESSMSTTGVTVIADSPDTSNATTSTYCGEPLGDGIERCNDQNVVGLSWDALDDDLIEAYYFSVGSSDDSNEDVIPEVQVGLNASGSVHVESGILVIGETPAANLSAMREKNPEEEETRLELGLPDVYTNKFLMEPGKVLVSSLKVCNKGHQCSDYTVKKVAMIRDDDEVVTSVNGEDVTLSLTQDENNDIPKVTISTSGGLPAGSSMAAGILTPEDLSKEYGSDASNEYRSFIVDPENTKDSISRALTNRIEKIHGSAFYVNLLGDFSTNGKINITMSFNMSEFKADARPRIIYWHTEYEEWHDASHTCADTFDQYYYDLDQGTITTQICSTTYAPEVFRLARNRKRRQAPSENTFSGPTSFVLANVNNEYQNTPPTIVSDTTIFMAEDSGTVHFTIRATDAESDIIVFRVNESCPSPQLGSADLNLDEI